MTITSNYKTETYDCDNGYLIDIVTTPEEYQAWISHKAYGVKSHMFGMPVEQQSYDEFREIVESNADEYIEFYRDDYEN